MQEPHDPEQPAQVIDPKVIAERRARRAEINEGVMRDRAREAERALDQARGQLAAAHDQRAELAARLKQAERDLRAAQQGEHAEVARRTEVEEDLASSLRRADEEAAALRLALAAEEQRVTELEEDLERALRASSTAQSANRDALAAAVAELTDDGTRHAALADAEAVLAARLQELQAVEESLAAARRELDARRGGLEERLTGTTALTADLETTLAAERAARAEAVRALEDERERGAAEVTLLQHELDRRTQIHDAVTAQLAGLRDELDAARRRADGASVTAPALAELTATAAALREDLVVLYAERGELERQLTAARAEVAERDERLRRSEEALAAAEADLARLRASISAATGDLPDIGTEAAHDRVRLQVAEDAVIAAEERAREIAARLAAEQRERARSEAQLQLQLAEERDALQQRLGVERTARTAAEVQAQVERAGRETIEARLAAERTAYAGERDQRILEARELQRRLDAAQEALAAAVAAEDRARRAEAERDRLRTELDARAVAEGDVRASLTELRAELEQVRTDADARLVREAQLEELLGDLVSAATSLREGFERELAALAAAREQDAAESARERADLAAAREADRVAMSQARDEALEAERERFAVHVAEMETRVSELRAQLGVAATELAGELAQERAARTLLESELARLRPEDPEAGGDDAPAPDPNAPASSDADLARLRADLTREEQASARAEDRIVELENELEAARTTLRSPPPMPPADHPALSGTGTRGGHEGEPGHDAAATSESVVVNLARAAARLRAPKEDAEAPDDAGVELGDAAAEDDAEVELGARMPVARTVRIVPRSWVTPALLALAERDHAAAAEIFEALISIQAGRLRRDLTYDLALGEEPALRVSLKEDGAASVERLGEDGASAGADFRLAGSLPALAPYVGGGTGWRVPDGVAVGGRRRPARRLLRAMRDPVGLPAIAALPRTPSPPALLGLVAGAIDPALTRGRRFSVAFAEGDGPLAAHVVVEDGAPLVVRSGEPVQAAATVRTAPGELARFLGGEAGARVSGDAELVLLLLGWADTAQGLDG